jgi:streptogramin lyase
MTVGSLVPRRLTGLDNRIVEFTEGPQEATPTFIAVGPDGNLWFGDSVTGGGTITAGGARGSGGFSGVGIAVAADGNIWEASSGSIIEVDPTTGFAVVGGSYGLPQGAQVTSVTLGPDGYPWFADPGRDVIGRVDGIAATPTEYQLPPNTGPVGIATGPDGALWVTESTANLIGRFTTAGEHEEWAIPTPAANAQAITTGLDGALWFIERDANQIGRITTAGALTEFVVPTAASELSGIAAGPDGAAWFTERMGPAIGRVTAAGAFTEYVLTNGTPNGITAGPDGNLWFTDDGGSDGFGKIGRLTPEDKPFARLDLGFEVTVDNADCRIAQQALVVQNAGDTATGPLSVDLDDSNPLRANVDISDHCSGVSLAPGDSCSIDFSHAPDSTGSTAFTLTISVGPTSGDIYSYIAEGC